MFCWEVQLEENGLQNYQILAQQISGGTLMNDPELQETLLMLPLKC